MSSKELKIDSSEEDSLEDLFQDTTELEEEEYINLEDNREGINLANFSGLKFPNEAYQLYAVPQSTSTPSDTPNASLERKSRSKVKDLAVFFEDSKDKSTIVKDTSTIKSILRSNKETISNKMSKLKKSKKVFERFEVEVNKVCEKVITAINENDREEMEDGVHELETHRAKLHKDTDKIAAASYSDDEVDEYAELEVRAATLMAKITLTIKKVKRKIDIKGKSTNLSSQMTSKLTKIEVPTFDGKYTEYKFYKTRIQTLISNLDELTQKIYLTESLKGKAYEYVEDVIKQDGNLDEIWRQLDAHFGNQHHVIDATIKAFFELTKPTKDIKKFEEYYIQSKNRAASLLALDHEPDQLLAAYFMLQIPGEYRSELEKKLTATNSKKTKYTFAELSPLVEEFVRIMKMASEDKEETETKTNILMVKTKQETEKQENEVCTNYHQQEALERYQAADNTTQIWGMAAQAGPPQYNRGRGFRENTNYYGFNRGRAQDNSYYRGRGYDYNNYNRGQMARRPQYTPWNGVRTACQVCDKFHLMVHCEEFKHGPEMREKLKELNRCDACLVKKEQHGEKCLELRFPCRYCKSKEHEAITCDGKNHPGSWLKKR